MSSFSKICFLCIALFLLSTSVFGHLRVRQPIRVPDILNYKTLKCDFHTHTVFSDGDVWPTVRAEEAWRNGLDAIAITDHLEYTPHKADIPVAHNRSYEIALPLANDLQVTLIKGSEITRRMPPGHLNALFISDSEKLHTDEWRDAVKAAADQKAFIFWNHPGWRGQQPDGTARWYTEHDEMLKNGWLNGIEVVNEKEYYPEAHAWCLEKKLTMLSNSDIHDPVHMKYDIHNGEHPPVTLVFATENSVTAIREALFDHRTAVLWNNLLVGEEKFLGPIFSNSIRILNPEISWAGKKTQFLQITNDSDISFELALTDTSNLVIVPENITLEAGKTVLFDIKGRSDEIANSQALDINYRVTNLKILPDKGLPVQVSFNLVK